MIKQYLSNPVYLPQPIEPTVMAAFLLFVDTDGVLHNYYGKYENEVINLTLDDENYRLVMNGRTGAMTLERGATGGDGYHMTDSAGGHWVLNLTQGLLLTVTPILDGIGDL